MEKTNLNNEENNGAVSGSWQRQGEVLENNQHPLPAYFNNGKSTRKSRILFIRIQPALMEQFELKAVARGLNPSEATRELISAWLRQPDQLPIGIPVGKYLPPEISSFNSTKEGVSPTKHERKNNNGI